ncbi:FecCD family ABC transporter permease [Psittacicella hinzii]|uniref:Iron complex transport system permease protein n=1 Tax=Psittacicella hinzii TaxID=2028575 RepID=A0A3A1YDH4_9GAMM|nr:iron chelate uptake ABC transporter family permease subunit [Psittacicella hinzii]RIY36212.1 hypothetical protein CKF58_06115 [Psittacicella hinzii]
MLFSFLLLFYKNKLNLLTLADDNIKTLGVNLKALKLVICLLALLLTSCVISVVGTIGFVGLLAPHIAQKLVGKDNRVKIIACMAVGSILLLLSDLVSRVVLCPAETPAGLIIAMLGSPYFLYLAISKK